MYTSMESDKLASQPHMNNFVISSTSRNHPPYYEFQHRKNFIQFQIVMGQRKQAYKPLSSYQVRILRLKMNRQKRQLYSNIHTPYQYYSLHHAPLHTLLIIIF